MSAKRSRKTTKMKLGVMRYGCDVDALRRVYRTAGKVHRIHQRVSVKTGEIEMRTRPQRRATTDLLDRFTKFIVFAARWKRFGPSAWSSWADLDLAYAGGDHLIWLAYATNRT